MIVVPKEAKFGAVKQAGQRVPHQRPEKHEAQQTEHDEKCRVGVWRGQTRRAHRYEADQESEERKGTANIRALPTCRSANDFRTAADAHVGALGDLRIAVWADQLLHPDSIPVPTRDRERIPQNLVDGLHPDARHQTCLAARGCLVTLRQRSHPLHPEFLQSVQKLPEVAPQKFDLMAGESEADGIGALGMGQ